MGRPWERLLGWRPSTPATPCCPPRTHSCPHSLYRWCRRHLTYGRRVRVAAIAVEKSDRTRLILHPSIHPPSSSSSTSRPSALVEVLHDSVRLSRRTVVELEAIQKAVAVALEREKKQFERLQFALKKATDDAAFAKSMGKLRAREKEELGRYRAAYGELKE